MSTCDYCGGKQAGAGNSECKLLISAYILAGLAMMLNIRLSYSSAPYALIRFRLPENLFSVFVRRMASALELWCLPSMLLGNLMEIALKAYYDLAGYKEVKWDNSGWNTHYGNLVQSSHGEDITTASADDLIPGRKWKNGFIIIPSIITQWLNFLTYVMLLIVYVVGGDHGHLTTFYWVIAISGIVFGINMTLVYAADYNYVPVYIAGENSFPALTSFIHYVSTLIFGNRRKYNSDFLIVVIDISVAIIISFVAAVVWTVAYGHFKDGPTADKLQHIFTYKFSAKFRAEQISPFLMIVVGMGLVYAIYPGIAPGMIVPFYLIDKIEMVLLIATIFPPVIVAILRRAASHLSPQHFEHGKAQAWTTYGAGYFYLSLSILIVIKISLAAIFIYSLHYRDSNLSRSIINQPKMSTFLSILFYMCHEILLALGFPGIIGNDGGDLILIPQYIGALFMIFLAFYSEGYIIEYKSQDPDHWPTEGMWYLYGYYQLNPNFFIMIKFNVCFDGYCDFK